MTRPSVIFLHIQLLVFALDLGAQPAWSAVTPLASALEQSVQNGGAAGAAPEAAGEGLEGLGEVQLERAMDEVADEYSEAAFNDAMLNYALLQAQSGVVSAEGVSDPGHGGKVAEAPPAHPKAAAGTTNISAPAAAAVVQTKSSSARGFGEARPEGQASRPRMEQELFLQHGRGRLGVKAAVPEHERSAVASQSLTAVDHQTLKQGPTEQADIKDEAAARRANASQGPGNGTRLQPLAANATQAQRKTVGEVHGPPPAAAAAAAAETSKGGPPPAAAQPAKPAKQEPQAKDPVPAAAATAASHPAAAEPRAAATVPPSAADGRRAEPLPPARSQTAAPQAKAPHEGVAVATPTPAAGSVQVQHPAAQPERPPLPLQASAQAALAAEPRRAQPAAAPAAAKADEVAAILAAEQGGGLSVGGLMKTRNRFAIVVLVVIAVVSIFGNACFAAGMCLSTALWKRNKLSAMRRQVEALPVCKAPEIEQRLPAAGGYDCTFSKPLSSKMLLRIEARVQRPTGGSQLMAPLTKKTCVLYSSAVSRKLHDGMTPVPVAFSFASVNFSVSLLDMPGVVIEVKGADVTLFDMREGRHVERRSFNRVPDDWQDFISSHRTSPHLSSTLRSDDAVLEFQECTLCVGAVVTMVGELHRNANGVLSMRPWTEKDEAARQGPPRERWRTSWEDWSCVSASAVAHDTANTLADSYVSSLEEAAADAEGDLESAGEAAEEEEAPLPIEKVLVSDNPELYRTDASQPCCGGGLCCGAWPRRWRFGSCAPARSLLGKEKGGQ